MNHKTLMKDIELANTLIKDRLDFGFDSIYFRYATIRDQLAYELARTSHDIESEKRKAETDKHHFYMTLEQLVHAHEAPDERKDGCLWS